MSGKGNCYDNAIVETFFKTLKSELVWRTAFQPRAEAVAALARYIDGFYNPRRRHSALGFTSPALFERGITHQTALHLNRSKSTSMVIATEDVEGHGDVPLMASARRVLGVLYEDR